MLRLPAAALLLALASAAPAADGPVPTRAAAGKMAVPLGFKVSLFAGEPDIAQPIAMTTDDRGRVWLVECNSYPEWSADKPGRDRVVILEDTDHDGTFDKKTVFLANGKNLSGIELGFGGVWLCSLPNLLFVPVNPGEDKPAGEPKVILDGWSLKCKHNVVNGLIWGPDGWLWGCNGIIDTSYVGKPGTPADRRTPMNTGIWRVHPVTHVFEPVMWGGTNPFGLDFDDYGEAFFTNCVIEHIWHATPGAHVKRMYGSDVNPAVYEPMASPAQHKHWAGGDWTTSRGNKPEHSDAGGGHSHSGCLVYLGDNFPPQYRNSVLMGNIHGNRLNRDTLTPSGSGYAAGRAPDFLFAHDPWFRPVCIKSGAAGEVYVADWSDTGECHNYEIVDRRNGRLFQVTYGTPTPFTGDVSKLTDAELVALQSHPNDWFCRHARRVLHERALAGTLTPAALNGLRARLFSAPTVPAKLRALWALYAIGDLNQQGPYLALFSHPMLLHHEDAAVRGWAVRLAAEACPVPAVVARLADLAATDSSPVVRRQLASAAPRLALADRRKLAPGLLSHAADNADTNLALLEWFAVEGLHAADATDFLKLATQGKIEKVRQFAVRQHLTTPTAKLQPALADVIEVLTTASDDAARRDILRGLRDGLGDRPTVAMPATWPAAGAALALSPSAEVRELTEAVGLTFADPRIVAAVTARVRDQSLSAAVRASAIGQLASRKTPGLPALLRPLLADPAVRGAAVRALANYPDPTAPAAVLAAYPTLTPAEKADAVQTLAGRPQSAAVLLTAIETGTIPKAAVTAFTARQLLALNDQAVSAKLAAVWGQVRPASATRAAQAAKFKTLLTTDTLKAADLANGRRLFEANCASCHKLFGEGHEVGPELTGSQRANLDYILDNVLDPSAVVANAYKMTVFNLSDGRVVTGIVLAESAQAVTVRTVNDVVVVSKADLEARKPTNNSVMPEGLLDTLTDAEVRDLVGYLASPVQVSVR